MGKVSKVKPRMTVEEIQEKIRRTVGFWKVQKWLVIYHATVDPKPARDIALHTDLAEQTVHNLISRYNRFGSEAVEGKGKGGRKWAYMSMEEETQFLQGFFNKAIMGEMTTVSEIKEAFEKRIGKTVHKSTIYRLLSRHGWRKVVPRPTHVEADKKEQEEFKKNFSHRS
jgi:transposase